MIFHNSNNLNSAKYFRNYTRFDIEILYQILGGQSTSMAHKKPKMTHSRLQIREKIDSLEVHILQCNVHNIFRHIFILLLQVY